MHRVLLFLLLWIAAMLEAVLGGAASASAGGLPLQRKGLGRVGKTLFG